MGVGDGTTERTVLKLKTLLVWIWSSSSQMQREGLRLVVDHSTLMIISAAINCTRITSIQWSNREYYCDLRPKCYILHRNIVVTKHVGIHSASKRYRIQMAPISLLIVRQWSQTIPAAAHEVAFDPAGGSPSKEMYTPKLRISTTGIWTATLMRPLPFMAHLQVGPESLHHPDD